VNSLHIFESLNEAAHTPAPAWVIQAMTPWFSGGNPALMSSGDSLTVGIYGLIGFISGILTYYSHNLLAAGILGYTLFHLWKLRNAMKNFPKANEGLEEVPQASVETGSDEAVV
jgi:hypothetical protein